MTTPSQTPNEKTLPKEKMRTLKVGEVNTTKLAVFPGRIMGVDVGWLNGDQTWCFVWGNFKTREQAIEVLKRQFPDNEIVNFEKENQPHHRYNPNGELNL